MRITYVTNDSSSPILVLMLICDRRSWRSFNQNERTQRIWARHAYMDSYVTLNAIKGVFDPYKCTGTCAVLILSRFEP